MEPTVSFGPAGLVPYQTGRVDDRPVNNRSRNQSQERDDHQRDTLSEALVLLLDASVVHQNIADPSGTS